MKINEHNSTLENRLKMIFILISIFISSIFPLPYTQSPGKSSDCRVTFPLAVLPFSLGPLLCEQQDVFVVQGYRFCFVKPVEQRVTRHDVSITLIFTFTCIHSFTFPKLIVVKPKPPAFGHNSQHKLWKLIEMARRVRDDVRTRQRGWWWKRGKMAPSTGLGYKHL